MNLGDKSSKRLKNRLAKGVPRQAVGYEQS